MDNQPPVQPANANAVQANLKQLAQLLRQADHLEPEAKDALANLVDQLSQVLDPAALPSEATTQLAANTANLVQNLQPEQNVSLIEAARRRVQDAVYRAETEAPVAADIAQRLLDAIANLGI
jgi:hypothetical protein